MQNSFIDYINEQTEHYPLGQLLWVMNRNNTIKVIDNKNKEIFSGKLKDFLVKKNEKYLEMPAYHDKHDLPFTYRLD